MQIWAESGKSALPICNYSQILYQFLTFTQNLKRSRKKSSVRLFLICFFAFLLLTAGLFLSIIIIRKDKYTKHIY